MTTCDYFLANNVYLYIRNEITNIFVDQNMNNQHEKLKTLVANNGGNSMLRADSLPFHNVPPSYASSSNNPDFSYGSSSNHLLEVPSLSGEPYAREHINIRQPPPPPPRKPLQLQHFRPLTHPEKMVMSELAGKAVSEVMKLVQIEEPMWIKSSIDGRMVIDQDNYEKVFPKTTQFKSPSARIESSKEVVVIPVDAKNLVEMFFDTVRTYAIFLFVLFCFW